MSSDLEERAGNSTPLQIDPYSDQGGDWPSLNRDAEASREKIAESRSDDEFQDEPKAAEKSSALSRNQKRGMIVGSIVFVVIVIAAGAIVGDRVAKRSFNGAKIADPTLAPAENQNPAPVQAPVSQEDSILSFLTEKSTGGEPFQAGSPHDLAADWIMNKDKMQLKSTSTKLLQRFALALLYFQTTLGGKTSWERCNPPITSQVDECEGHNSNRWLSGADECTWYAVICDEKTGFVDAILHMIQNNLSGPIPSALSLLTNLRSLDIFNRNDMRGSLPLWIYDLTQIERLEFGGATLSGGSLSSRIGLLTSLTFLSLEGGITDSLPSEIGALTLLEVLDLSDNKYFGGILPSELYNLRRLTSLYLKGTAIHGSISESIGQLSLLEVFQIDESRLSQSIPSQIGLLKNMESLSIRTEYISGVLPSEIFSLVKLKQLNIRTKRLIGKISTNIGQLSSLEDFSIVGAQISGKIPSQIGLCKNLVVLDLVENSLSGQLPSELGNLKKLTGLYIDSSQDINGPIPDGVYNLTQLRYISFFRTSLSGTISSFIGKLTDLSDLFLSLTQLSGTVPTEVDSLSRLRRITLDRTLLNGTFPCDGNPFPVIAAADCMPVEDPPMSCYCCTHCCNRETGNCDKMFG